MQKGLIRKGLVCSIILLFITVGVQPIFAGESITTTLDKEEDCIECQVSDGISLLRVKILLFKVRVITNFILSSKLSEIPEIKESCQEIIDIIDLNSPLYSPIICGILSAVEEQLLVIFDRLGEIFDILWEINEFLAAIYALTIDIIMLSMLYSVYYVGLNFDCWDETTL